MAQRLYRSRRRGSMSWRAKPRTLPPAAEVNDSSVRLSGGEGWRVLTPMEEDEDGETRLELLGRGRMFGCCRCQLCRLGVEHPEELTVCRA